MSRGEVATKLLQIHNNQEAAKMRHLWKMFTFLRRETGPRLEAITATAPLYMEVRDGNLFVYIPILKKYGKSILLIKDANIWVSQ